MSAMASILVRNVITVPISTSSESPSTVRLKDFILCLFFHFIASEWLKELIPITFEYLTRSVLRLVVRNILGPLHPSTGFASASPNPRESQFEIHSEAKSTFEHHTDRNTQTTTNLPYSVNLS